MRVIRRIVDDERGVALVMALVIMAILAGTTVAVILPGAVNQRSALKSADARQAFALAQTALAYGEGAVYNAGQVVNGKTITISPGTWTTIPTQAGGGTAKWEATAITGACSCTWSITAAATVDSITRQISVIATDPSTTQVANSGVWNYLYADSTAACTSISGSVTISVPILLRGCLSLGGSMQFSGASLEVGGNLSLSGSAKVGASASKIPVLRVGGTCQAVTPGTAACDGSHSPIYATSVGTALDVTPQMPCIGQPSSLDSQCSGANDGTWTKLHTVYNAQAAATKTGCPANLLDSDSTLNNGDTLISSVMFGSTDYDCKVGSIGEIKWTHSTNSLYVNGTLYFDGSLTPPSSSNIVYTGQASLYFTGGISTTGSGSFCGISNCTASWNPDTSGVIFIAGCWSNTTGSTLITSSCVNFGGSTHWQVGVYATTQYTIGGSASNFGPVLANTLSLGGSTSTLIPFHNMPPNTPMNTEPQTVPGSLPSSWSG